MKHATFLLFLFTLSIFSQEPIEATLVKKTLLDVEHLVSVNNFSTTCYINNNVLYKNHNNKTLNYNNLQLGNIESANTFNPLKINIFYKDFNTLIILDNRLSEIFKTDFNAINDYKNVSHVSTGHDNTVWIFNQDIQNLELFDYKQKTSRAQTQPVQSQVLDLKSNFNYCWLLTKNQLYTYNYFGSLIKKLDNKGYTAIAADGENLVLKKDNNLLYLNKNDEQPAHIILPNIIINQFFVINETLYIYTHKTLYEFQLKIK
ncbi:hypothetical protein SAMN04489722_103522 [Algibacter lectus]|uniref:hypothetical protein n=1 Tax=Algibacter lectus TaxID=221126 RepID=UPI0008E6E47C|nr:hypothetical protein [Algibacter lectus]SFC82559.1 hypothetical protein SAMN04489722_103522 [Algibacter lectus]